MQNSVSFADELLKISLNIVNKSQAEFYLITLAYIAIAEALVAIALEYIKSPQKIDSATFKLLRTIA